MPPKEIPEILNSVKKNLGIAAEYDVFDHDIVTHINSAFFTLRQLAVGPDVGFNVVDGTEKWTDFLGSVDQISLIKTYVSDKVRLAFDPPTTSFAITAIQERIKENEFRMNVFAEGGS